MQTAQLFIDGKNQGVMFPKEYRFVGSDIFIQKVGEAVILFPKDKAWETFLHGLNSFSDDFMSEDRQQGLVQDREVL
ncbi:MAG: type II toxin-antitoxin system VapB family antitoxin [Endomicrobium sp.]|jgi:antitoxin VapB|nr:type II toxin-antitoxin system VapB family antitoxin [Endomicrobium sp.]